MKTFLRVILGLGWIIVGIGQVKMLVLGTLLFGGWVYLATFYPVELLIYLLTVIFSLTTLLLGVLIIINKIVPKLLFIIPSFLLLLLSFGSLAKELLYNNGLIPRFRYEQFSFFDQPLGIDSFFRAFPEIIFALRISSIAYRFDVYIDMIRFLVIGYVTLKIVMPDAKLWRITSRRENI